MSGVRALPQSTSDGEARRAALAKEQPARTPTSLIAYTSAGSLLIIAGEEQRGHEIAQRLEGKLRCTVLVPGVADGSQTEAGRDEDRARTIRADVTRVAGHLGAFEVAARVGAEEVPIAPSLLTEKNSGSTSMATPDARSPRS